MDEDIFRGTPLRYMGYANEVGEAFRSVLPTKAVWFTYGLSSGYVTCDAADKGFTEYVAMNGEKEEEQLKSTAIAAADALVWQTFASVIVPGFTINRLCWATRFILCRGLHVPWTATKYISVAVGLAAIPFIVKPIDHAADEVMNKTLRTWIVKNDN